MSNKEIKIHPEISISPEMKDIENESEVWSEENELEYLMGDMNGIAFEEKTLNEKFWDKMSRIKDEGKEAVKKQRKKLGFE